MPPGISRDGWSWPRNGSAMARLQLHTLRQGVHAESTRPSVAGHALGGGCAAQSDLHARIRRIDTLRAEALPGVHAAFSSANCPDVRWYAEQTPCSTRPCASSAMSPLTASQRRLHRRGRAAVYRVEYEPLPFVADLEAALAGRAAHSRAQQFRQRSGAVHAWRSGGRFR